MRTDRDLPQRPEDLALDRSTEAAFDSAISTSEPIKPFYPLPSSPLVNLTHETLSAGTSIVDLPDRKKLYSNSASLTVRASGNARQILQTTTAGSFTILIDDITKLAGSNKAAKRLFTLALIKANDQAVHNGKLTKDHISFSLQELIDLQAYSTIQSARKGFTAGADILTSLKVAGSYTERHKGKEPASMEALEVLFTGARRVNGQCFIYLNNRVNWGLFTTFFTYIPQYYFRLSNRASDLLLHIFSIARMSADKIAKQGYFTIGFRAIQQYLQLPSEIGNTKPAQLIKKPIEDAIAEIEEAHSKDYHNTEFQLLPVYGKDADGVEILDDTGITIKEYLENGYLKITLKGSIAAPFIEASRSKTSAIKAREASKKRIEEKARAINLAKAEREDNKPESP